MSSEGITHPSISGAGVFLQDMPSEEDLKFPEKVGLPKGWTAHKNDSGTVYYHNQTTQVSKWERPSADEAVVEPTFYTDVASAEADLPSGWTALKDADSGRYYFNLADTTVTTWESLSSCS